MKIRRVEQIKGLPRQTGNRRISRRISFARFQRARFALCRIVYYRPSPGYTPAIEWRGNGRDLDARNLLALIPFMSRSKVNPRAARTWSFEKITKRGGRGNVWPDRHCKFQLLSPYQLLFYYTYSSSYVDYTEAELIRTVMRNDWTMDVYVIIGNSKVKKYGR